MTDPTLIFDLVGPLALLGWIALVLAPLAPHWADRVAALVIPALLSVAYTALILAFWSGAPGGFDTLDNVMLLFTDPGIALAGWIHYLAFDLFVGAWIVRTARADGIPHLLIVPILVPALYFAPAGFLLFVALRAVWPRRAPNATEA